MTNPFSTSDPRPIPQRRLGSSGREVGAVGLGCMGMTWAYNPADRDDARSIAAIHRAIEIGVTLIDTADMYGPYTNEELVAKALAGRRDAVTLATKCGLVVNEARTAIKRDGRPEHVRESIDASLRRLGTEHVDLYHLHRVDPKVPIEETWGAMAETVTSGKTGAIGLSDVGVSELERAHAIHPVASVESELSLWTRDALDAVLPWCAEHDAAFIPFSPLGRGFLTGSITTAAFADGDIRALSPRFSSDAVAQNLAIVDRVREVGRRLNATPAQVALAWVLAQGDEVVPIPGTTRPERLDENASAAFVTLSPDDLAELDGIPAAVGARHGVGAP
jgi:aryl-alcohol dehydrogenase-like predicted oxidoreductase